MLNRYMRGNHGLFLLSQRQVNSWLRNIHSKASLCITNFEEHRDQHIFCSLIIYLFRYHAKLNLCPTLLRLQRINIFFHQISCLLISE